MEKIDLNEVKRIIRVRSGKETEPTRYEKKLAEVKERMTLNEIEKDLKELKTLIDDPDHKGTIDLAEVRKIRFKASNPDEVIGLKRYLFHFKGKFYLIEGNEYRKIEDAEARMQLDQDQDIELYYLCSNESMCPLPNLFTGRYAKAVQVKNDAGVIEYIRKLTVVTIKL